MLYKGKRELLEAYIKIDEQCKRTAGAGVDLYWQIVNSIRRQLAQRIAYEIGAISSIGRVY